MARYLALDAIQPGDIVLSASRSWESYFIRLFTASWGASHAALAIHPLIWIEAVDIGVKYRVMVPQLVWDGSRFRLCAPIAGGETYTVKRLNKSLYEKGAISQHEFAKKLIKQTGEDVFLDYALKAGFLRTIRGDLGKTEAARFIANYLDRSKSKLFPGPFCSSLVAKCYQNLGHSLFDKEAQEITPAALDKCDKLDRVKGASFWGDVIELPARFKKFAKDMVDAVGHHYCQCSLFTEQLDLVNKCSKKCQDPPSHAECERNGCRIANKSCADTLQILRRTFPLNG